MVTLSALVTLCQFPGGDDELALAVSGGSDSVGLALLAKAAGRRAAIHHVDHQLRPDSADDARLVESLARRLGWSVTIHTVNIARGGNLEARARDARRSVLPRGTLTGHTMDDLAETVLMNMLRGAGLDGLTPMVGDATKPILRVRRGELRNAVVASGEGFVDDATNRDVSILRNQIRLHTLPELCRVAKRDIVPVLARQAELMSEERQWLDELLEPDVRRTLAEIDCRELREWPAARLRRWLHEVLRDGPEMYPPSADDVERVVRVVRGDAVATELSGGRRVARTAQHLYLSEK